MTKNKSVLSNSDDCGLGLISVLVAVYALIKSLIIKLIFGSFFLQSFFVFLSGVIPFLLSVTFKLKNKIVIITIYAIQFLYISYYDYELAGVVNKSLQGGLALKDQVLANFDQWLFNQPVANFIENILGHSLFSKLFYDFILVVYAIYIILPLITVILMVKCPQKKLNQKLKDFVLYNYISIFLVFTFYLIVPVKGPKLFLPDSFVSPLPFTLFGSWLYPYVESLRVTQIDCFPSGHLGICLLMTSWMYLFKLPLKKSFLIYTVIMALATMALRYHYVLDLAAAVVYTAIIFYFMKYKTYNKYYAND